MAGDRVQLQLDQLNVLRAEGLSDAAVKHLRKALTDKVNVVVAKAAEITCQWQLRTLEPELLEAFNRLLNSPESDPQCWGKNSISHTLKDLGHAESAVFIRGLQHRQLESTWGGKTDTAGVLRGTCALALVQCTDIPRHETLRYLVDALTEPEARVRADAARAMEQMGGREAVLLLRLKARAGDKEARVTGQVMESILQMEGAQAVAFVADFLRSVNEEIREEAALALGACRLPEAVEVLKQEWSRSKFKQNGIVLLRAISASRQDAALLFLLDLIRSEQESLAQDALYALELHKDSEELVRRIEDAVAGREEELRNLFQEKFRG